MKETIKTLGVYKFASCGGCQLTVLDGEAELLALGERVRIVHFPEATSEVGEGDVDLALVEGSITTPADARRIAVLRRRASVLVTIGACATSGGIQALRDRGELDAMVRAVYPRPELLSILPTSTPVADHVTVDFELRGCPIDREQLMLVLSTLLRGRKPKLPTHPVCLDCKRNGTVCVMVASGIPCLGPVTQTGCRALCPAHGRGCYGCFGPSDHPQVTALSARLRELGTPVDEVTRLLRSFNGQAYLEDEAGHA